jgi:hypothetical protein
VLLRSEYEYLLERGAGKSARLFEDSFGFTPEDAFEVGPLDVLPDTDGLRALRRRWEFRISSGRERGVQQPALGLREDAAYRVFPREMTVPAELSTRRAYLEISNRLLAERYGRGPDACRNRCGGGRSGTFGSTRRSSGSQGHGGDPNERGADRDEPDERRDDGRQEGGLVDLLDGYAHQDQEGVGDGDGAEHRDPGEHEGGVGVGHDAVRLREVGDLADEGPDREQVDRRRYRDADRREHREQEPLHDRRPEVVRAHPPGQHVRDQGHDGPKHAGDRPDEQREQDRLLQGTIGLKFEKKVLGEKSTARIVARALERVGPG